MKKENNNTGEIQHKLKKIENVNMSKISFIGKYTVIHTIVYFFAGIIFYHLMNYKDLFASPLYSYMRPMDSTFVMLGPLFQIARGAIIALAFLPFREIIIEKKYGWFYLFAALFILLHFGADSITPGAFESFIYTNIPFKQHFPTYPESIIQSFGIAWLSWFWMRRYSNKIKILFISIFVLIIFVLISGVIVSN